MNRSLDKLLVGPSDLTFKVGSDNTPAGWPLAPPPTSINVRWGAGPNGADRIFITWADNAIQNQWLRVALLANNNTRLESDSIFYYGSSIGAAGASQQAAAPSLRAAALALENATATSGIDSLFDFDRDGIVGVKDVRIALDALCNTNALPLIDLNPGAAQPGGNIGPFRPGNGPETCGKPAFLWTERAADRSLRCWFATTPGAEFQVEQASSLGLANWQPVSPGSIRSVGEGIHSIVLARPDGTEAFFRITQLPSR